MRWQWSLKDGEEQHWMTADLNLLTAQETYVVNGYCVEDGLKMRFSNDVPFYLGQRACVFKARTTWKLFLPEVRLYVDGRELPAYPASLAPPRQVSKLAPSNEPYKAEDRSLPFFPKSELPNFVQEKAVPFWGWGFVLLCGIIPVVSLGGALPAGIGIAGIYGCHGVLRRSDMGEAWKAVLCSGITVLCWALYLGLRALVVSLKS